MIKKITLDEKDEQRVQKILSELIFLKNESDVFRYGMHLIATYQDKLTINTVQDKLVINTNVKVPPIPVANKEDIGEDEEEDKDDPYMGWKLKKSEKDMWDNMNKTPDKYGCYVHYGIPFSSCGCLKDNRNKILLDLFEQGSGIINPIIEK
jgi:hypothetical protein